MYDGLRRASYMITVGETLRRERLKRNLALDQVSRELKISIRFLEAIEDEEFEKLPGGVFAKAFVRQYGRLLGLNDEELAAQLQQTLEPPSNDSPELRRPSRSSIAPIQVPRMEEWQTVGDRRFHWSGPLSAAIVVVVVMLICSGIYTWLQRPRNPVSARSTAPVSVQVPAAPTTEPSVPQPAPQQTPSEPPAAAPSPAAATPEPQSAVTPKPPEATPPKPETAAPSPTPDATIHVALTAEEPVWVLARADGKVAFSGTLEPQQTRTVDAVESLTLRLGNAGGVSITFNGKTVGPVGPKGQIRTVQFTSGGFQIVPAAKPPSDGAAPVARL